MAGKGPLIALGIAAVLLLLAVSPPLKLQRPVRPRRLQGVNNITEIHLVLTNNLLATTNTNKQPSR